MNTNSAVDEDYYRLFEIARDADEAAIRAAIKAARKRWRQLTGSPDKDRARLAEQRMEQLEAAETILLDDDARARYDAELDATRPAPAAVPNQAPSPEPKGSTPPAPTVDWGERARKYYFDGDFQNAFLAAKKGTDLTPENNLAWSFYGWSAIDLKRHQDADFASAELVHRLPNDASAHELRGAALDAVGRYADAETAFRNASRFAPANSYYQGRAAWALLDQGRANEAVAEAWKIVDRFPDDDYPPRVLRAAAEWLRERNRPTEAFAIVAALLSKRPADDDTILAAALSLETMADTGEVDAALVEAWRLLDAYPHDGRVQGTVRYLIYSLRQSGRSGDAVVQARNLLSRYPDDQSAREALAWARIIDAQDRMSKDGNGTYFIVNKAQADYFGGAIAEVHGLGVADADVQAELAKMQGYLGQQTKTKVKLGFWKVVLWIVSIIMVLGGLGDITNGGLIWLIFGGLLLWAAISSTIKKQYRLTHNDVHPDLRTGGLR